MPPPLPNAGAVLLGLLCGEFWPWPLARYAYALSVGILLACAVAALSTAVHRAFRRHGTSPDPAQQTTAIIDTGPFRRSRNPVYIAVALLQLALGFIFNNAWIVLLTLPAMLVVHYVVVLPEEAYLQARFGATYDEYKSQVRRWL